MEAADALAVNLVGHARFVEILRNDESLRRWVESCASSGMSRREAISAIRAEWQVLGSREKWESMCSESEFRILTGRVDAAINDVYPETDEWSGDGLVKYLTWSPGRRSKEAVAGLLPAVKEWPPIVWWRRGPDGVFSDAAMSDVDGQLNVGFVFGTFDPWDDDTFYVNACRRVPSRMGPKYGTSEWPFLIEVSTGFVGRRSGFSSSRHAVGSMTGKPSSWTTMRGVPPKDVEEVANFAVQPCIGMAFSLQYEWQADLRIDSGLPVRMAIGPHEAKELFRLRDIADGDKRRAALLHLVKNHRRRRPHTVRDTIEVREHLRGREAFSWFGVSGRIIPPKTIGTSK